MLGAGTVVNIQQIDKLEKIGVDFIVCPGLSSELVKSLLNCKIPKSNDKRISNIILGIGMGLRFLSFFRYRFINEEYSIKFYINNFSRISFCELVEYIKIRLMNT